MTSYSEAADLGFARSDDVVQMIGESVRVLQGDSQGTSELNALRWLVHLVGDVHQPIHVGCGFVNTSGSVPRLVRDPQRIIQDNLRHDRGGNNLILPVSGNVSLHSYWDSRLAGDIDELDEAGPLDGVTFGGGGRRLDQPRTQRAFHRHAVRDGATRPVHAKERGGSSEQPTA